MKWMTFYWLIEFEPVDTFTVTKHIQSEEKPSDALTKGLTPMKFEKCRKGMNIVKDPQNLREVEPKFRTPLSYWFLNVQAQQCGWYLGKKAWRIPVRGSDIEWTSLSSSWSMASPCSPAPNTRHLVLHISTPLNSTSINASPTEQECTMEIYFSLQDVSKLCDWVWLFLPPKHDQHLAEKTDHRQEWFSCRCECKLYFLGCKSCSLTLVQLIGDDIKQSIWYFRSNQSTRMWGIFVPPCSRILCRIHGVHASKLIDCMRRPHMIHGLLAARHNELQWWPSEE